MHEQSGRFFGHEISGRFFELFRPEEGSLTHHLPGFKFDGGPGWNDNIFLWFVGIPADAGFGQLHFKDPKITKLNFAAMGEGIRDHIQGSLQHVKHLRLNQSCFFADGGDNVFFGEI